MGVSQNYPLTGGIYHGQKSSYDGQKFFCLDDLVPNCLIYSFGLNTEISFEKQAVKLGETSTKE